MYAFRLRRIYACFLAALPILSHGTTSASLQQLVCAASEIVVGKVVTGHGIESGYGADCTLSVSRSKRCQMADMTIEIYEIVAERPLDGILKERAARLASGQTMELVIYADELLLDATPLEVQQTSPEERESPPDASDLRQFGGKKFIFSFDRTLPYPPGSQRFYSNVFKVDQKTVIRDLLSTSNSQTSCPQVIASQSKATSR